MRVYTRTPLMERLWPKVQKGNPDECWPWLGAADASGYGKIGLGGKTIKATRAVYEDVYGPFDTSLFVCHTCDNPPCVNPSHLFLGTHQDNMDDCVSKGRNIHGERARARHRVRGEAHGRSKLTETQVLSIRERVASGQTMTDTAAHFGISIATVSLIVNRKKWTHI